MLCKFPLPKSGPSGEGLWVTTISQQDRLSAYWRSLDLSTELCKFLLPLGEGLSEKLLLRGQTVHLLCSVLFSPTRVPRGETHGETPGRTRDLSGW